MNPEQLQTGDWVLPLGLAAQTSPGLGKIVDATARHGSLEHAQVTFLSTTRWIHASALRRVAPEEEHRIVQAALQEVDLSERQREALRALLDPTPTFVRTPGLLDALYALLHDPDPTPGLAHLFERDWTRTLDPPPAPKRTPAPPPNTTRPTSPTLEPASTDEATLLERPPRPPLWPGLPDWTTPDDLATGLRIGPNDLAWFTDLAGWLARAPDGPLQHYTVHWLRKPSGGVRLVESPKECLKSLQRQVLRRVLDRIPPHEAAHGFRAGRDLRSFVAPHVGRPWVLRMDLRHFFASISAARVAAVFRAVGYQPAVAHQLSGLVTTRTPHDVLASGRLDHAALDRLHRPHLPQGAPTSPALANLCAYGLDVRLSALATVSGARYTRYADDLAFSGDHPRQRRRLIPLVLQIATEEGFSVHWEKTRVMPRHQRQRLVGLVVNERARPSRADYDRLRATLFNCARFGLKTQNRASHPDFLAHLEGRVQWFARFDPQRGAKLHTLLERIDAST